MYVTLTNDFHRTEVRVRVPRLPYGLSDAQNKRVYRTLCGMDDCYCVTVHAGRDTDGRPVDVDELVLTHGWGPQFRLTGAPPRQPAFQGDPQ